MTQPEPCQGECGDYADHRGHMQDAPGMYDEPDYGISLPDVSQRSGSAGEGDR